ETDCRVGGKISAASDVFWSDTCRRWGTYELRRGRHGSIPARRHLRRQDPQRRQACGSSRRTADEVRTRHKSQNSEADRSDDSAKGAGESGPGDSMIRFWILDFGFWII